MSDTAVARTGRALVAAAVLAVLASGCGAKPESMGSAPPAAAPAAAAPRVVAQTGDDAGGVSIGTCFEALGGAEPSAACPAFFAELVRGVAQTCSDAGGRPVAAVPGDLWTFDVNGDGRLEVAFAYDGIVVCEEAWSVFSCGSLGCPKVLYQEGTDGWAAIGELFAGSADSIEIAATGAPNGNRDLRVGCGAAAQDCAVVWNYTWRDGAYQRTTIDVRGHRVDFEGSVHGLYSLVAATAVLATPAADAVVLEHYDAATEVAIVGTAANGYYYVSPCNACESGFVPTTALSAVAR